MNAVDQAHQGLNLVRRILDSDLLNAETEKNIEVLYTKILQRLDSSYLELSIIGEFSAGKSTLINGLLGLSLLKTNLLACTGVPTYLCGTNADAIKIVVQLPEEEMWEIHGVPGRSDLLEMEDVAVFLEYIKQNFGIYRDIQDASDTQAVIALLTSDDRVARHLNAVKIEIPHYPLGETTRLIDTPGINASGAEGERHGVMTREILKHQADALLLVLDSSKVYSVELERFLQDNASGFMKHSVIVINKSDLIPEDEREEVRKYVRDLLQDRFGVDARIYLISARNATDHDTWQREFQKMTSELLAYLNCSHEEILNEMALTCVKEAIQLIKLAVQKHRDESIEQKKILEENQPEKLDDILRMLQDNMDREVIRLVSQNNLQRTWRVASEDCGKRVCQDLESKQTKSEIKYYATGSELRNRIHSVLNSLESEMKREMVEINDSFYKAFLVAIQKMQDRCQTIMKNTPTKKSFRNDGSPFKLKVDDIMIQTYTKTELESKEKSRFWSSVGGALAVGYLLGPVGWLAGPAISYAMNRYKIDEAKANVVQGIKKSLMQDETQMLSDCTHLLETFINKRKQIYTTAFHMSKKEYKIIYDQVVAQTQNQCKEYEREIRVLEDFLEQMVQWEMECAKTA